MHWCRSMSMIGMSLARPSDLPRRWPARLRHPQPAKPKLKKRKSLEDSSTESAEAADSDPQELAGSLDDSATWVEAHRKPYHLP